MNREALIEEILGLEEVLPVLKFSYFELSTWNDTVLLHHLVTLEEKIA